MTPAELAELDADRSRARRVFVCWLVLATALTLAGNAVAAVLPSLPPTGVRLAVHLLPPLIALVGLHALTALARAGAIHRARKGATAALRDAGPVYGGAVAGVLGIAALAVTLSYAGLIEVARAGGLSPTLAAVWPLVIDLGIAVSTMALLVLRPISAADQRAARRAASAGSRTASAAPSVKRESADRSLADPFTDTLRETEGPSAKTPAEPIEASAKSSANHSVDPDLEPFMDSANHLEEAKLIRGKTAADYARILHAVSAGWSKTRIKSEYGYSHDTTQTVVDAASEPTQPRLTAVQ